MRRRILLGLALGLAIGVLGSTQASAYRSYGYYGPRAYGYSYYRPRGYGFYYRPRFYGAYLGGSYGRWWGPNWRYRAFSAPLH